MKIAVISDTHGLFRPQVREWMRDCDAVIHAGDINSQKVLDEISAAAGDHVPFYVVRGNNDREWAENLPESLEFELEGTKFFLVHNKKDVPKELGETQVVIYGHSHKYAEEEKGGRLWLNPGSCGRRRFHQPVTMAVLTLEPGGRTVERIDISTETGSGDIKSSNIKSGDVKTGMRIPQENLLGVIDEIFIRMDKGQTVNAIGKKMGLDREFVAEICRIRVTHPGVTPGGIMDKMEVNEVVSPPNTRKSDDTRK